MIQNQIELFTYGCFEIWCVLLSDWGHLHVGLEIVFTSTSKGTEGTLVAFQACVDHHVPLPVAFSLDHQTAYWALKGFPSILRRTWKKIKILIDHICVALRACGEEFMLNISNEILQLLS